MTSPDQHPDEPTRTPSGEAPAPNDDTTQHAVATSETDAREVPAAAPAHGDADGPAQAAKADADPRPGNDQADDGEEGDDDEPSTGQDAGGDKSAAPGETGAAPGAPGKKKRRRRRKKKPQDGAVAEGGAPTEGGAADGESSLEARGPHGPHVEVAVPRDRPRKKDRPREPRERPAFNFGDVVFGKITEITDDALIVDLSGKAMAIFDRRELDLPDDLEYGADPEEHDEEPLAAESAAAEGGATASADEATLATEEGTASPEETTSSPQEITPHAPSSNEETVSTKEETTTPAEETTASTEQAAAQPLEATEATAPVAPPPEKKHEPIVFPVVTLEVGANFVGIVHNDGGRGGLVVLTRHPKRVQRAKLVVGGAFKEKGEILGLVTGIIKGGVEVDVDGLRAFAPGSHMDLRLGSDLHPLLGKRMLFVVTQYAKRGKDVVLSRKPFLEAEAKIAREVALKTLTIGAVVEGVVRSVVPFGAFIDVGGVEGLVPLSEMSHNRGDGPHDVFKLGEKTPVKILKVDERGKVWLSRRAAIPDPWLEVAKKYAMGTKLTGTVARLQPFGAFIELEPGIDGLIHTADLSLKRIEHPNEVVKEGDPIDVMVVHLDVHAHKIGLHPAPTGAAANEAPQRVQLNKPCKVAVVGYEGNGLVVRILGATGRHARGFISAAGTGTPRGTDLRRDFPMGKQLDAKVTELDQRGEVKLSIKALSEDTERTAYRQYREQVTREAKFGTLGDLLKKNLQK